MGLVWRWRCGAVGAYAAAGRASRATPVDGRATTHDSLIQATSELDPGQIAAMPVHGVVVARRQQYRPDVVVGIASACEARLLYVVSAYISYYIHA